MKKTTLNPRDMVPEIKLLPQLKLVGQSMKMTFAQNRTYELWRQFMPLRKQVKKQVSDTLYSVQIYPVAYFDPFNPEREFEKWATVQVSEFEALPPGMRALVIPAGLYAVFLFRGANTAANAFFQDIFEKWLPAALLVADDRPHFEMLGPGYRVNSPDSEETVWIPVRPGAPATTSTHLQGSGKD